MEALLVAKLPAGEGWQFEPKWDGFRCLAFCDGDAIELISKSGKPLGGYFPEVVAMLAAANLEASVLDGELVVPIDDIVSFGALQARLHPAESRVRKLAAETPARYILFDCIEDRGEPLVDQPLSRRRAALEALHARVPTPALLLSPVTRQSEVALSWLRKSGGALDGVVAKRIDDAYRPGERAMLKVKQRRTADCVVGGFRYDRAGRLVASLLLGLYDEGGRLSHVGFTSGLADQDKAMLTKTLEALIEPPGFTGKAPGGPSRWATKRSSDWQPLRPELVVEVLYDQVTDERFRHGTRLLRWRPDKAPRQCRMEQLIHEMNPAELAALAFGPDDGLATQRQPAHRAVSRRRRP